MYKVIKDLYKDNRARIRIGEYESQELNIKLGVMQGSILGPILFNIFINDLLEKLHLTRLGVGMPKTIITALGYADDIVLLADNPSKLQEQIDICEKWSSENGMRFNTEKCKVMALNVRQKGLAFHISGETIEVVQKKKYLGIIFSRSRQTTLYGKHITKVLERAEARVNLIRHTGFLKDGLRPEISIRMYKTMVRPILEYGAQVLSYKHYYFVDRKIDKIEEPSEIIRKLEKFQNKVLKKLIPCPKNTPPEVIRLLTGTMPIEGRIDMLKLRYFWRLHHAGGKNMAHQIYLELRENFLKGKEGFIHEVFNLCCKYRRIDLWHGKCPEKINPLARIRKIVEKFHIEKDEKAARKSDCMYSEMLNVKGKKYMFEERLKEVGRFHSTEHRGVFLHAILDTAKYERNCKNCDRKVNDLTEHGLEECTGVKHNRRVYTLSMKLYDASEGQKLLRKREAIQLALTKKCYMKAFCEFLLVIWKWDM